MKFKNNSSTFQYWHWNENIGDGTSCEKVAINLMRKKLQTEAFGHDFTS